MLTDETIRKIFEEEKNSQGLTKLPEDFFGQVKVYLENKSKMAKIEPDRWALDSVRTRLRKISRSRERKILNSAPIFMDTGVPPENMTSEETKFFEKIIECMKEFHRGSSPEERKENQKEQEKLVLVSVLEDIPRFVGINLRNYGPFRKGDITTLPEPNADLLVKKGLAEKTEIK